MREQHLKTAQPTVVVPCLADPTHILHIRHDAGLVTLSDFFAQEIAPQCFCQADLEQFRSRQTVVGCCWGPVRLLVEDVRKTA